MFLTQVYVFISGSANNRTSIVSKSKGFQKYIAE